MLQWVCDGTANAGAVSSRWEVFPWSRSECAFGAHIIFIPSFLVDCLSRGPRW